MALEDDQGNDITLGVMPRPHVMGWGESHPAISEERCSICGGTDHHDVIVLGEAETKAIVKDMRRN